MNKIFLSLLAPLVLGGAPAPVAAQDTDNAALLYWQAISAVGPLSTQQKTALNQKAADPLDETAAEDALVSYKYSLETVKRAADKPTCNWGLNFDEGPGLRLSYLSRLQELAQALRLRARLRLQRGDGDGAADDLVTMLRFSRHVGEPPLLISWLVQITVRGIAIHTVADNLPKFSDAALSRLSETLRTLPPGHAMPELMRSEKRGLGDWMARRAQESLRKHESAEQAAWYQEILYVLEDMERADVSAIRHLGMAEVAQAVGALPQDYDELIRLVETPDPQSRPALHEFMERVRAGKTASPLSAVIMPVFETVGRKGSESLATQAMLLAMIEARLLHGGPEALSLSHDPYNDGAPFAVREVDGGLELQSKVTIKDKPVTLRCAW